MIQTILGITAIIIGIVAMVFVFRVNSKFAGKLKISYGFIAFGILSAYLSGVSFLLNDFHVLSAQIARISAQSLLLIAAVLIIVGSVKMLKTLSSVAVKKK